ncbi:bromodomain-containing protein 4-like [Adelges cooleyi]|uniref:bromodomain-containing protein 4-like n=1 Tax=Adelges cooleyi TaxID=133065 RepID=UPI00217FDCA7|nr:bromodomain-containing protein 4-like [Adelges cooleyi]
MAKFYCLIILCFAVQLALAEDRISVDTVGTVGTITATAGYSIADSLHSATSSGLTSELDFPGGHLTSTSKEASTSGEAYTVGGSDQRNSQSLALRSRQARGKPQTQWRPPNSGSEEDKDQGGASSYPLNEQLYSVKPQTFDPPPPSQLSNGKPVDDSEEKSSVPAVTYGKKMHKDNEHDDRPTFGSSDWSEEVRMKFDADKPTRSRKKNRYQQDSSQEKRKPLPKKLAGDSGSGSTDGGGSGGSSSGSSSDHKDGWQEVSPNLEIATGYVTTVQDHDSSQESTSSSESYKTHTTPYEHHHTESISSIEHTAPAEPQNFNHKQVLSKMNHFDFSNAVSQVSKTPREKRLNYQPSSPPPPPSRYPYSGHQSPLQSIVPSSVSPIKSVKIEQPNYHSIVVPIPFTHQMYAAMTDAGAFGHHQYPQLQSTSSSTVHQAMMSLPVVHNVFFKTDENGAGKTMPAIVIPLKPEYLQHLQQQQQYSSLESDSPSLRPSTSGKLPFQGQQQQHLQSSAYSGQQQQQSSGNKQKQSKPKKPVFVKPEEGRVKQPFSLQQHSYYNPYAAAAAAAAAAGHHQHPHHQQQQSQQQQYHESADDNRYAQSSGAPIQSTVHPYAHSVIVKRPQAYGYVSPAVNKFRGPSADDTVQLQLQAQLQQPQMPQMPFKAAYHGNYAYLTGGPEEDYPYRPIYKDVKKRNDVMVVRSAAA